MTQKDYILIAEAIRATVDAAKRTNNHAAKATIRIVAERIALKLQQDNSRFNSRFFMEACGL